MVILADLANVASVLGGLVIVAAVAAVRVTRFSGVVAFLSAQPLRSAAPPWPRGSREERILRRALTHQLRLCHKGADLSTAAVVWAAVRLDAHAPAIAYHGAAVQKLHKMISSALQPDRRGLLVHYLASEAWNANRIRLEDCRDYLAQFLNMSVAETDHLMPLPHMRITGGDAPVTFADFTSAFSGASVLLDTTQVQGGAAAGVLVMHRSEWEGNAEIHGAAATRDGLLPYAAHHAERASANRMDEQRIGQYDGSIPTLVSAELVEYQGLAGVRLALTTRETCYSATEPSPANPLPAKGLAPAWNDARMACFEGTPGRLSVHREHKPDPTSARPVQLNVVLGLVCRGDRSSKGTLILTRRASAVRNAAFCLAPTSGGVIELPMRDLPRDADRFGAVDPTHGMFREAREELGIPAERIQASARALYLSTVRNRPKDTDKWRTGQLVASILYLAGTDLTVEEVRQHSSLADPVEGAFESVGIVGVELGASAHEFVENLKARAPDRGGEESWSILDDMEQSAVLVALYASAWVHEPERTIESFTAGFPEPWWSHSWPLPTAKGAVRLCRRPGAWLSTFGDDAAVQEIERFWPGQGKACMERLHRMINDESDPG